MGMARREAERLADQLLDIPPAVSTRVTLYGAPEAGSALQGVLDRINALPSQKTIGIKVVGGTTTRQADGGFWEGRVTARADGGFDEYGRPVPRTPQIRAGSQGVVQWGEPETNWEAYISGKPGMKERNVGVLMEAASRLGVLDRLNVRRYADGGLAANPVRVSSPGAGASMPPSVTGNWSASLKGAQVQIGADGLGTFVSGVVKAELDGEAKYQDRNKRAGRGNR
jgi:hypothetical protein